jgi:hypothetical protein
LSPATAGRAAQSTADFSVQRKKIKSNLSFRRSSILSPFYTPKIKTRN